MRNQGLRWSVGRIVVVAFVIVLLQVEGENAGAVINKRLLEEEKFCRSHPHRHKREVGETESNKKALRGKRMPLQKSRESTVVSGSSRGVTFHPGVIIGDTSRNSLPSGMSSQNPADTSSTSSSLTKNSEIPILNPATPRPSSAGLTTQKENLRKTTPMPIPLRSMTTTMRQPTLTLESRVSSFSNVAIASNVITSNVMSSTHNDITFTQSLQVGSIWPNSDNEIAKTSSTQNYNTKMSTFDKVGTEFGTSNTFHYVSKSGRTLSQDTASGYSEAGYTIPDTTPRLSASTDIIVGTSSALGTAGTINTCASNTRSAGKSFPSIGNSYVGTENTKLTGTSQISRSTISPVTEQSTLSGKETAHSGRESDRPRPITDNLSLGSSILNTATSHKFIKGGTKYAHDYYDYSRKNKKYPDTSVTVSNVDKSVSHTWSPEKRSGSSITSTKLSAVSSDQYSVTRGDLETVLKNTLPFTNLGTMTNTVYNSKTFVSHGKNPSDVKNTEHAMSSTSGTQNRESKSSASIFETSKLGISAGGSNVPTNILGTNSKTTGNNLCLSGSTGKSVQGSVTHNNLQTTKNGFTSTFTTYDGKHGGRPQAATGISTKESNVLKSRSPIAPNYSPESGIPRTESAQTNSQMKDSKTGTGKICTSTDIPMTGHTATRHDQKYGEILSTIKYYGHSSKSNANKDFKTVHRVSQTTVSDNGKDSADKTTMTSTASFIFGASNGMKNTATFDQSRNAILVTNIPATRYNLRSFPSTIHRTMSGSLNTGTNTLVSKAIPPVSTKFTNSEITQGSVQSNVSLDKISSQKFTKTMLKSSSMGSSLKKPSTPRNAATNHPKAESDFSKTEGIQLNPVTTDSRDGKIVTACTVSKTKNSFLQTATRYDQSYREVFGTANHYGQSKNTITNIDAGVNFSNTNHQIGQIMVTYRGNSISDSTTKMSKVSTDNRGVTGSNPGTKPVNPNTVPSTNTGTKKTTASYSRKSRKPSNFGASNGMKYTAPKYKENSFRFTNVGSNFQNSGSDVPNLTTSVNGLSDSNVNAATNVLVTKTNLLNHSKKLHETRKSFPNTEPGHSELGSDSLHTATSYQGSANSIVGVTTENYKHASAPLKSATETLTIKSTVQIVPEHYTKPTKRTNIASKYSSIGKKYSNHASKFSRPESISKNVGEDKSTSHLVNTNPATTSSLRGHSTKVHGALSGFPNTLAKHTKLENIISTTPSIHKDTAKSFSSIATKYSRYKTDTMNTGLPNTDASHSWTEMTKPNEATSIFSSDSKTGIIFSKFSDTNGGRSNRFTNILATVNSQSAINMYKTQSSRAQIVKSVPETGNSRSKAPTNKPKTGSRGSQMGSNLFETGIDKSNMLTRTLTTKNAGSYMATRAMGTERSISQFVTKVHNTRHNTLERATSRPKIFSAIQETKAGSLHMSSNVDVTRTGRSNMATNLDGTGGSRAKGNTANNVGIDVPDTGKISTFTTTKFINTNDKVWHSVTDSPKTGKSLQHGISSDHLGRWSNLQNTDNIHARTGSHMSKPQVFETNTKFETPNGTPNTLSTVPSANVYHPIRSTHFPEKRSRSFYTATKYSTVSDGLRSHLRTKIGLPNTFGTSNLGTLTDALHHSAGISKPFSRKSELHTKSTPRGESGKTNIATGYCDTSRKYSSSRFEFSKPESASIKADTSSVSAGKSITKLATNIPATGKNLPNYSTSKHGTMSRFLHAGTRNLVTERPLQFSTLSSKCEVTDGILGSTTSANKMSGPAITMSKGSNKDSSLQKPPGTHYPATNYPKTGSDLSKTLTYVPEKGTPLRTEGAKLNSISTDSSYSKLLLVSTMPMTRNNFPQTATRYDRKYRDISSSVSYATQTQRSFVTRDHGPISATNIASTKNGLLQSVVSLQRSENSLPQTNLQGTGGSLQNTGKGTAAGIPNASIQKSSMLFKTTIFPYSSTRKGIQGRHPNSTDDEGIPKWSYPPCFPNCTTGTYKTATNRLTSISSLKSTTKLQKRTTELVTTSRANVSSNLPTVLAASVTHLTTLSFTNHTTTPTPTTTSTTTLSLSEKLTSTTTTTTTQKPTTKNATSPQPTPSTTTTKKPTKTTTKKPTKATTKKPTTTTTKKPTKPTTKKPTTTTSNPEVPCFNISASSHAGICECRKAGCGYNSGANHCDHVESICNEHIFSPSECVRNPKSDQTEVFYLYAGVACPKSILGLRSSGRFSSHVRTNSQNCKIDQTVMAVNLGRNQQHVDGYGIQYFADNEVPWKDPHKTRKTDVSLHITGIDKTDQWLYRWQIWGDWNKAKPGNCATYEVPLVKDGEYELSIKLIDNYWRRVGPRGFNIRFNGIIILVEVDLIKITGKQFKAIDVILNFKVKNRATHLEMQGYPKSDVIDGQVDLAFCFGECGHIDDDYHVAGFSVVRFASKQDQNSHLGCDRFRRLPCLCKETGCEYSVETGDCRPLGVCSSLIFQPNECRRTDAYYSDGGVLCRSHYRGGRCDVAEILLAVNLNGNSYRASGGVYHQADSHVTYEDKYKTRTTGQSRECFGVANSDRELYCNYIEGISSKTQDNRCIEYKIPISLDGSYEMNFKMGEFNHDNQHDRSFNIQINGETIIKELDILALTKKNTPIDIVIPFTVLGKGELIWLMGYAFKKIEDGEIKLGFCYGSWHKKDSSWVMSAFSVIRYKETFRDISKYTIGM